MVKKLLKYLDRINQWRKQRIFLAAEITGGYVLMVPLMIVSAIAYFINK